MASRKKWHLIVVLLGTAICLSVWGNPDRPASAIGQLIVAHRGASHDAPENTMAAFQLAWEQGADGIEADFHLTSDGQVVCIHDADTLRTAGVKLVIADCTFEQLGTIDVGSWKGPQWATERIPTLGQVLEKLPADKWLFIELKTGPEIVPAVQQLLADYQGPIERLVIISFNQATITRCAELLPSIRRHWLVGFRKHRQTDQWEPPPEKIVADWKQIPADGIGFQARREVLNATMLQQLRETGFKEFHTWTIDDPRSAKHFQKLGTQGITTNRPQFIRDQLGALTPTNWTN